MFTALRQQWRYDPSTGKHIFCGENLLDKFNDAFKESAAPRLSDVFSCLGLKVPYDLPEAFVRIDAKERGEMSSTSKLVTAKFKSGLNQLQTVSSTIRADTLQLHDQMMPLPDLAVCTESWKQWLASLKEVGPEQANTAISDAQHHLRYHGDDIMEMLEANLDPGEDIESVILSSFMYTYEFTEPVFWAVFRGGEWNVHPQSAVIEGLYKSWNPANGDTVSVSLETIDFKEMVSISGGRTHPVRRIEGPTPTDFSRQPSSPNPFGTPLYPKTTGYTQTFWWAIGAVGNYPMLVQDNDLSDWSLKEMAAGNWYDADIPCHIPESLWSNYERFWTPTRDVEAWMSLHDNDEELSPPGSFQYKARKEGESIATIIGAEEEKRRSLRRTTMAIPTISSPVGTPQRSFKKPPCLPELSVPKDGGEKDKGGASSPRKSVTLLSPFFSSGRGSFRKQSAVSVRSGSVLCRITDERPPSPTQSRASWFDATGDVARNLERLESRKKSVRKTPSQISRHDPPLIQLLRSRFTTGEEICRVIATLEEVVAPGGKKRYYFSFEYNIVVVCDARELSLFTIFGRLEHPTPHSTASLLSREERGKQGKGAVCLEMALRAVSLMPISSDSVLKQLPSNDVTIQIMNTLRRGNVLLNRGIIPVRPTVECSMPAGVVNVEFMGMSHDLSCAARFKRQKDAAILPGMYEVVSDLSLSSEKEKTSPGAIVRQITGSEIVQARVRQLLSECDDMRLAKALGDVLQGEHHIRLHNTDPTCSNVKIRIDKQVNEMPGTGPLIPTFRDLSVEDLCMKDFMKAADGTIPARYQDVADDFSPGCNMVFGLHINKLQVPHLPYVILTNVEPDSNAERLGLKAGSLIHKVNHKMVKTVAHANRTIRMSLEDTVLVMDISQPSMPQYGMWEVASADGAEGMFSVLPETPAIEVAYRTYGKGKRGSIFEMDAVMWGASIFIEPSDGKYFTEANVPTDIIETLRLELPPDKRACEWFTGSLPPGTTGVVVGSFKSVEPLTNRPPTRPGYANNTDRLGPSDAVGSVRLGSLRELDDTQVMTLRECRLRMQYPASEFTEALRVFQGREGMSRVTLRKSAAMLIEAFAWAIRKHSLGWSAVLRSVRAFAQWYRLSGFKRNLGSVYYCVSLSLSNKLVIVHHSAVRAKDLHVYDLEKGTRKLLLERDPRKWILDVVRRVEKHVRVAVGDEGVALLSRALELQPPGVHKVTLSGNDLTDACIPHLVSVLIHNPNITAINLEENPRIRHAHKRSLGCVIRCNSFECNLDHEDLDFIELQRYVVARREELLPAGDMRIALGKNALGVLYHKAAKMDEAEKLLKDAWQLAAFNQTSSQSVKATQAVATILHNLGTLYLARGDFSSGKTVFLRSFEGIMKVTGGSHPCVWRSLSKYADLFADQRERSKALFWYKFAWKEMTVAVGPRDPHVAECALQAAKVQIAMGNHRNGIFDILKALHVLRCQLDIDDMAIFKCLHQFSEALNRMSYSTLAFNLHDQALYLMKKSFKERRIKLSLLAEATLMLATYYKKQGEGAAYEIDAEGYFKRADELFAETKAHHLHLIPEKHPEAIAILIQHASVLVSLKRLQEALPMLHQGREYACEVLGQEHPMSAEATRCLGKYWMHMRKLDVALEVLHEARAQLDDGVGTPDVHSPTFANILHDIGYICGETFRFEEGEDAILRCLKINQLIHSVNHPIVARDFLSLSRLYKRMGMYDEAEDYCKRSLTMQLQWFPESRKHLLLATESLAQIRHTQGKTHEAKMLTEMKHHICNPEVYLAHGLMLEASIEGLKKMLKKSGSIYDMKEVSWDARMQYVRTKALRSYPVDLVRKLPPYNPFKRPQGVPLSSVDQALRLQAMTGLCRLVRHMRVVDTEKPWTGIRLLERAVMTAPEHLLAVSGDMSSSREVNELHPTMFGVEEVEPVWTKADDVVDPTHSAALDRLLMNSWARTSSEDPVIVSLSFLAEQLEECKLRQQAAMAEELFLECSAGLMRKYFKMLTGWRAIAAGIREADATKDKDALPLQPQLTGRLAVRVRKSARHAVAIEEAQAVKA